MSRPQEVPVPRWQSALLYAFAALALFVIVVQVVKAVKAV